MTQIEQMTTDYIYEYKFICGHLLDLRYQRAIS